MEFILPGQCLMLSRNVEEARRLSKDKNVEEVKQCVCNICSMGMNETGSLVVDW